MRAQLSPLSGRYEAEGLEGLIDRRLEQASNRLAPVDEVMALTEQYRSRHTGWNVKHFHSSYGRSGGVRSYDDALAMLAAGASRLGVSGSAALLSGATPVLTGAY